MFTTMKNFLLLDKIIVGSVLTCLTFSKAQDDFSTICGRNVITDRGFINQPRARRPDSDDGEPIGTWPWMVSIGKVGGTRRSNNRDRPWTHHCGGSLLTASHVLTAAHCVEGREGRRQELRFGDRNVSSSLDDRHMQLRGIRRVHLHPNYDYETAYHDVAIVELDSKVRLSNQVRPLCLPEQSNLFVDKYDKYHVKMTGWGKETRESKDIDGMLLSVSLKVFSHRYCQETHWARDNSKLKFQISRSLPDLFKSSVMCAGDESGGYGSCDGDSGSPIFYFQDELGTESAKYIMVGMVQGGLGFCGDSRFPGIYIRMEDEYILSFIKGIIGGRISFTVQTSSHSVARPKSTTSRPAAPNPHQHYNADLYELAKNGDLQGIRRAVQEGADVNRRFGQYGYGAMHGASHNGNVDIARFLVNSGANVDLRATEAAWTPLHLAATDGHLNLVEYLVDSAGADIRARDSEAGQTPLMQAAKHDRVGVLRFLVRRGADIDGPRNDGATPLIMTVRFNSPQALRTLVSLGVNVDARDSGGLTALYWSALEDTLHLSAVLVEEGAADPDVATAGGFTPLHSEARDGDLDGVRFLVEEAGAAVNLRSDDGQSALAFAEKHGRDDVARYLRSVGGTY